MKYKIDLHTHTLISGHAYSTIQENVKAAAEKGLILLGISEHAPKMPGSTNKIYFQNLKVIPREMYGIRLLFGVEVNILDFNGNVDLDDEVLRDLDYAIASLHPPCIGFGTVEENTNAIIGAMKLDKVKIIGHPDDSRYVLDYEAVVKAAKENNVLLEVNNSSLSPNSFRINAKDAYIKMLEYCEKYEVAVIIGSDAHISFDVGNQEYAVKLLEEVNFPEKLIANNDLEMLFRHLNVQN
jgi:putative hydrolase